MPYFSLSLGLLGLLERYHTKAPIIKDAKIATNPEDEDILSTAFSKTCGEFLLEKEYIKSNTRNAAKMPIAILFQSYAIFTKCKVY